MSLGYHKIFTKEKKYRTCSLMTHGFLLNGKNEILLTFIFSRSHSSQHIYLAKDNSEAVTFQSLGALSDVLKSLTNVRAARASQAELTSGRAEPFQRRLLEELCLRSGYIPRPLGQLAVAA